MAIQIDELHMETQPAPAALPDSPTASAAKPRSDLQAEMEIFRERRLRLQAD
jgi:hypothetical protein